MKLVRRKKVLWLWFLVVLTLAVFAWFFRFSLSPLSSISHSLRKIFFQIESSYHAYLDLRGVHQENLRLREEMLEIKGRLLSLEEKKRQWMREEDHIRKMGWERGEGRLAPVIGFDPKSTFRSLTLGRGSREGIQLDQVVVAQGGLVGRVVQVHPHWALVLLISDPRSSVDVLDLKSRARGNLVGLRKQLGLHRERWLTQAEYIDGKQEVHTGDLLLTSGQDGLFPKGIPAGVVRGVQKDFTGLFWEAEVEPYVEFNKLEEALVLPAATEFQETQGEPLARKSIEGSL